MSISIRQIMVKTRIIQGFALIMLVLVTSAVSVSAQVTPPAGGFVRWSPDGQKIAVSGRFGIHLFNAQLQPLSVQINTDAVDAVAWSPDNQQLVSADADYQVRVWNVQTGQLAQALVGHTNLVYSVSGSPDGSKIASGGVDGTVRIWNASNGTLLQIWSNPSLQPVYAVSWSPDGTLLAIGSDRIRIVTASSLQVRQDFAVPAGYGNTLFWSPDSKYLLFNNPVVVDVSTGQSIGITPCDGPQASAWSPDGRWIAVAGLRDTGGFVCFVDFTTGLDAADVVLPYNVISLSFNPDGSELAAASPDGDVIIANTTTGQIIFQTVVMPTATAFTPQAIRLTAVCYSSTGQYRKWHLANPNTFEVQIYWSILNSTQKQQGQAVIPAATSGVMGERYFNTTIESDPDSVQIFSPSDTLLDTKTSNSVLCPADTPTSTPTLGLIPTNTSTVTVTKTATLAILINRRWMMIAPSDSGDIYAR